MIATAVLFEVDMKKLFSLVWALLLTCLSFCFTPEIAYSEERGHPTELSKGETLQWEWEEGHPRIYQFQMERRQIVEAERKYETSLLFTADLIFTPKLCTSTGTIIQIHFDNLKLERRAGKVHQKFNSEEEESRIAENPVEMDVWKRVGRLLMDSDFQLFQTKRGRIALLEGVDERLTAILKESEPSNHRLAFLLNKIFKSRHFERILNSCMDILPVDKVQGRKWKKEDRVDLGMDIDVVRKENYRFIGTEGDADVAIAMHGHLRLGNSGENRIDLPDGEVKVGLLDSSLSGETLFSRGHGCILSQDRKGHLAVETVFSDIPGKKTRKAKSELYQTTRLELKQTEEDQ